MNRGRNNALDRESRCRSTVCSKSSPMNVTVTSQCYSFDSCSDDRATQIEDRVNRHLLESFSVSTRSDNHREDNW